MFYYFSFFFFFNDTATTEIYTLSLHDALPISTDDGGCRRAHTRGPRTLRRPSSGDLRALRLPRVVRPWHREVLLPRVPVPRAQTRVPRPRRLPARGLSHRRRRSRAHGRPGRRSRTQTSDR